MFVIGNWPVADSKFDVRFLLNALRGRDPDCDFTDDAVIEVLEPHEEKIAADKGFASNIIRVRLQLRLEKTRNTRLTKSVVLKIPTDEFFRRDVETRYAGHPQEEIDELHSENRELIVTAHKTEIHFFEFVTRMKVPLRVPRYYKGLEWDYLHDQQGIIVMEDVTEIGKNRPMSRSLTLDEVKCVVNEIVTLQCASLEHSEVIDEFPIQERTLRGISSFVANCVEKLRAQRTWLNDETAAKLTQNASVDVIRELLTWTPQRGLKPVLVHGDLWPNNILWKNRPRDDTDLLAAIVDFQAVHAGNYTTDLAGLMAVSVLGTKRRAMEENVLRYYRARMASECAARGLPFDVSIEMIRDNYKRSLKYALHEVVMTVATNPADDLCVDASGPVLTNSLRLLLDDIVL